MKYLFFIIISFSTTYTKCQVIKQDSFDIKRFEKVLFEKLNHFRAKQKKESLLWSDSLYLLVTKKRLEIILHADYLHHPDKSYWNLENRNSVSKNSYLLTGVKTFEPASGPYMTFNENCQILPDWSEYKTYQELAEYSILTFEKSHMHKCTQYASYLDEGKKGLAACSSGFTKKGLYICFNFIYIYRTK